MPINSTVAVTDTETTGMDPAYDQIVEYAVVNVGIKVPAVVGHWSALAKPTVPISLGARAAHHITDEELASAPPLEADVFGFRAWAQNPIEQHIIAAHNAEFDRGFLVPFLGDQHSWICTMRCAEHLWPDAGEFGYSNQVLRYWLGLKPPAKQEHLWMPPHRALPDAHVTAHILIKMLETHTADQLVELTRKPILQKFCRIGEWRGKLWSQVDHGMLRWILKKDFSADIRHTASHYLNGGKLI